MFSDTSNQPGFFTREWLLLISVLGDTIYTPIRLAVQGANHDYIYNHTAGPDWLRGFNADMGIWNAGPQDLLSFSGGISIWRYLKNRLQNGEHIDFKGDPVGTAATINAIITESGIPSEHVWNFITNFERITREEGTPEVVRPELAHAQAKLDTEGFPLFGIALGLGALVAIRYIIGPSSNANR